MREQKLIPPIWTRSSDRYVVGLTCSNVICNRLQFLALLLGLYLSSISAQNLNGGGVYGAHYHSTSPPCLIVGATNSSWFGVSALKLQFGCGSWRNIGFNFVNGKNVIVFGFFLHNNSTFRIINWFWSWIVFKLSINALVWNWRKRNILMFYRILCRFYDDIFFCRLSIYFVTRLVHSQRT